MIRSRKRKLNSTGKQECTICNEQTYLVEHHIRGRKIHDPNHPSNLCYICSNCHQKIHRGDIIIEQWIRMSDGLELIWHNKGEQSFTGNDATVFLL